MHMRAALLSFIGGVSVAVGQLAEGEQAKSAHVEVEALDRAYSTMLRALISERTAAERSAPVATLPGVEPFRRVASLLGLQADLDLPALPQLTPAGILGPLTAWNLLNEVFASPHWVEALTNGYREAVDPGRTLTTRLSSDLRDITRAVGEGAPHLTIPSVAATMLRNIRPALRDIQQESMRGAADEWATRTAVQLDEGGKILAIPTQMIVGALEGSLSTLDRSVAELQEARFSNL